MNDGVTNETLASKLEALDRHLSAEIVGLRRETLASNEQAAHAIEVAAHEASERLEAHNNLIAQMREQAQNFATREALENRRKEVDDRISTVRDNARQNLVDYKSENDKRFNRLERFQYTLTGGIILLGAVGIANLVKVFTG